MERDYFLSRCVLSACLQGTAGWYYEKIVGLRHCYQSIIVIVVSVKREILRRWLASSRPFPAATTSIVKTLGTTAWHQSSVAHLYRSPVRAVTGSLAAATGQRIARCSSAARRYRDMFRTSFIDRLSRFVERTAGRCGAHRANVSFSL